MTGVVLPFPLFKTLKEVFTIPTTKKTGFFFCFAGIIHSYFLTNVSISNQYPTPLALMIAKIVE